MLLSKIQSPSLFPPVLLFFTPRFTLILNLARPFFFPFSKLCFICLPIATVFSFIQSIPIDSEPHLFSGSHYLGPFFPSATLTLFLCTSAHVRNSFRFDLCSLAFRQLNEEATVTWKMASLYLPTNVFLFVYLRTGSIFYSVMHLVQQFIT